MKSMVDSIDLPNGISINVWDESRQIAADTVSVVLVISSNISIEEYFKGVEEQGRLLRSHFGDMVRYTYRRERTFVPLKDRKQVFSELLEEFKVNVLGYLTREEFPLRFIQSKMKEIANAEALPHSP